MTETVVECGCTSNLSLSRMPGEGQRLDKMQGHWLLARAGKRVLRPGGLALTRRMLDALAVSGQDRVVEFAPGMGVTAQLVLRRKPLGYCGVEQEPAAAARLESRLPRNLVHIVRAQADASGLPGGCATIVYGEAMLSMQTAQQKTRIVCEAARLLAPGGRYGIHELCLRPEGVPDRMRQEIAAAMSREIHVGVQPLCCTEWAALLEAHGLNLIWNGEADMDLLEPRRMIEDEGFGAFIKIAFNIARDPAVRRRVLAMRRIFRKYAEYLGAISMVAVRKSEPA